MKRKHVITTLALSMLLGVGVFAGIHQTKAQEAKAAAAGDTLTFYIDAKNAASWVHDASAVVKLQTWNGTADVQYDCEEITTNVFMAENVDTTGWAGFKFVRVGNDGKGDTWDFSSWSTDFNKRYFVHSGSGTGGTWSADAPATYSTTLSVEFSADVPDYADIYIPGGFNSWSDDVSVSKMTRVSDTVFTYDVNDVYPGSYSYKIVACYTGAEKMDWDHQIDADNQTVAIAATDDGKTINLAQRTYDFATNMPAEVVPDVPEEDGYYIVGSESNWKFAGATKMSAGEHEYKAQLLGYEGKAGESFKVRSYLETVDTWHNMPATTENYNVGEADKLLDIYVNSHDEFIVVDHESDIPAEEGYYISGLGGKWTYADAIKMTNTDEDGNVALYVGLEAEVDDEIRVRSFYHDRLPKNNWANVGNGETEYGEKSGENFKFTKAGTYDVYAKYEEEVFKFYVAEHVEPDVPAEDGYYIVGTESEWKFEGATKMDAGDDADLAKLINYQAKANEEFRIRGYHDGVPTWYQWGQAEEGHEDDNYLVGAEAKALDIFLNAYGQYYVFDHEEPDIPAEEGYYICGLDGWRYENATKMVAPSTVPGNVAHYMGLEAKVDDEIRVRSYFDDSTPKDKWAICGNGEETYGEVTEENNFKFTKAGTYDIYAYYMGDTFKYSVAEHVDSYTVEMTGVNFNGKAAAGTISLADQTAYSSANFEPELPIQNGYVARGVYEDEACTTAYTPKVFDAAGHLYVKYTKIGVYMVGDDTFSGADLGWTVDGATILPAAINDTDNNLYEGTITITGASVQNPVEVRPANYTFEGELDYSMEYSLGVAYDFAKKVGNNIQFTENGTFAVYFNKSNQIYLNKGADAFYTKFLTEVGGICDPDGDTNLTNLASVWAAQEDAFNSLSKTERDAIKAVGFDGGDESGDDLHKVIAKYHYILTKYGTAVLNDFIFNQIDIEANVNTIGVTADDSVMTIVVIASISVISAAGLFFLIRRKRRLVK